MKIWPDVQARHPPKIPRKYRDGTDPAAITSSVGAGLRAAARILAAQGRRNAARAPCGAGARRSPCGMQDGCAGGLRMSAVAAAVMHRCIAAQDGRRSDMTADEN